MRQTKTAALALIFSHFLGAAIMSTAVAKTPPPDARSRANAPAANPAAASPSRADAPAGMEAPPRVVLARIGKEELTMDDYMAYMKDNPERAKIGDDLSGKALVIKAMISDKLIRQEIIREGLVEKGKQDDDQAMVQAYGKLEAAHFPPPEPPSDEEALAHYQQNREDYGIPVMWRISQIQFRFPRKANEEMKSHVREKAEQALKRLQAGEPFEKVAGEMTENNDGRERKGDVGFVPMSSLPLSKDVLASMKLNQPTGIVETPTGYEILMKTDERPEVISPFEQVKERIVKRMIAIGQGRRKDAYLAELTEKTPVTIVADHLKQFFPNGVFSKAPTP